MLWKLYDNSFVYKIPVMYLVQLNLLSAKQFIDLKLESLPNPQWISLLYRRLQILEQIKSDHCDRYQNKRTKNAIEWHWSHTSKQVGT